MPWVLPIIGVNLYLLALLIKASFKLFKASKTISFAYLRFKLKAVSTTSVDVRL